MSAKPTLCKWLATALLVAAGGCAPAYHAYPCGCVPYGYCPDPPLPYTGYCGCPTPWAARFHQEHATTPVENATPQPLRNQATPSAASKRSPILALPRATGAHTVEQTADARETDTRAHDIDSSQDDL